VDPGPELERSSLLHQANKAAGWLELPYVLRHGRPPAREGHRDTRSFALTMAEGDPLIAREVVDSSLLYLARGGPVTVGEEAASGAERATARTMIDIGGAVGHVALLFAERGFKSLLLDRPEVLPIARDYLQGDPRVEFQPGDFLRSLPPGPFALAFLGNVYHIYGPSENAALTRRVFASLAPGGVIAIRDYVMGRSPRAPLFAVNMLQATECGGVWTEQEFRTWLEAAGFVDVEVVDLQLVPNQLILGRRPPGSSAA
jgi:hypothetical protein